MQFCVYLFRDPKTSILRYVGKGRIERPHKHLKTSHNRLLDRMIKKRVAEGFVITPQVISADSNEDAVEMEMFLIATIGRQDLGLGTLFNFTDGGEGQIGWNPTLETRANMRTRQLEIGQLPHIKAMRSEKARVQFSRPECRAKISEARSKPCTVDGLKIYPSRVSMIDDIGQSKKTGCKQPSFRYV